jgi:hypothetical protein
MSDIELVFTELFYGSGIWLGLLIILSIVVALSYKSRYAGALCLPVTVFMGIDYITNYVDQYQLWASLIMFSASLFLVLHIATNKG